MVTLTQMTLIESLITKESLSDYFVSERQLSAKSDRFDWHASTTTTAGANAIPGPDCLTEQAIKPRRLLLLNATTVYTLQMHYCVVR